MTTTRNDAVDTTTIAPLGHAEAMDLLAVELQLNLELMRSLPDAAWRAQTDCPDWDVRRMYLHVLGACESGASMREMAHQMIAARRRQRATGGPLEAALSGVQVAERVDLTPAELIERFAAVAPRTVRSRRRLPGLLRRLARMPVDGPVVETWTLGYLVDTIYLRDAWMHRVDVARATGATLDLTAEHDGRIVADVVAEWARRHGAAFTLILTGPAGGTFRGVGPLPSTAETHELDAVEFCRTLAGRAPGEGLLATIVPF